MKLEPSMELITQNRNANAARDTIEFAAEITSACSALLVLRHIQANARYPDTDRVIRNGVNKASTVSSRP